MYMCVVDFCFLKWIKRNINVNFVIKFSVMEKVETDTRRLVFFIRGNVLRGDGA